MALLQCEMCCGELEISTDKSVGVCKYCGSTFTIPKEIEKKGNLFNRANYLRQSCNFDKAIGVYESILADDCEDADALWGLVLCRYGIEFVEDPKTGTRIPTCHRTSKTSILVDPDFKSALRYADEEKRDVYYENASRIDQIQKSILALSDSQEKYDVFICYKESDDNGERTIDSVLAQELYNELAKMKIKTFFARKTLEDKAGSNYEPIIYSALSSAKVMIVLGTKPEYFEAIWVKNEWSRYLDFMKESDEKHLIPVYRDMSAYQLPEEFISIQAIDMSRIGFMLDLCDGVKKLLRKDEFEDIMSAPISKESLYSRAMVFLGNREFYKAVDYFDKVLDIDPQYARAYWGSLLASYQCVTANELINYSLDDWTDDARLLNAIRFANEEEKNIYENALARRRANFENLANIALEHRDFEKCQLWCQKSILCDNSNGNIWRIKLLAMNNACNSNELYDNCLENSISLGNTEEYMNVIKYSVEEERMMFERNISKIDTAVKEKNRLNEYENCRWYLERSIDTIRKKKDHDIHSKNKDLEDEFAAFKLLKNSKGHFYKNNIFAYLIQLIILAIPIYLLIGYLSFYFYDAEIFLKLFAAIFAVIILIMLFINLCIYIYNAKNKFSLLYRCKRIVSKLKKDEQDINILVSHENKMQELYTEFLSNQELDTEQIQNKKKEFEILCGHLKKNNDRK